MQESAPNTACQPPQISGYSIVRQLGPCAFLATAAGGRRVVLKPLDDDCLLKRKLHPQIKDRLERVRELAMLEVANLIAVERERDRAWMVWEYVEGQTLDEWLAEPRSLMDLRWAGREIIRAVESLHALGLVHGALAEDSIVVQPAGRLRLTHVSPLLYDDPENDRQAVVEILRRLFAGSMAFPQEQVQWMSLREMAGWIATAGREQSSATAIDGNDVQDRRIRRGALVGAGIVALVGGAVAYGAWRMAYGAQPRAQSPSEFRQAENAGQRTSYNDRTQQLGPTQGSPTQGSPTQGSPTQGSPRQGSPTQGRRP